MRAPVLVVIGKKDIQVDWRADGEPLQRAAQWREVSFLFPDEANHVLKHESRPLATLAPVDAATNYNGPESRLDQAALAGIVDWLAEHK